MKFRQNHISILIVVCVLCLTVASQVWSATYYVDINNGTDDPAFGRGPDANAWKTLHYAVAQLQNSDILNVAAGTYSTANGEQADMLPVTQNNITIQGIAGTTLDGGLGCTGWEPAFNINASGVTIKNMKFVGFTCDGGDEAILISAGSDSMIESCEISGGVRGIVFESNSEIGNIVQSCTIHDNSDSGVVINDSSPEVNSNWIYNNTIGIDIREYNSNTITPKIINNLVFTDNYSLTYGLFIDAAITGSTISAQIFHNTIDGGEWAAIFFGEESIANPVTEIKYNIITNSDFGIDKVGGNADIDYNCFWGNGTDADGIQLGVNNKYEAPLYMNAAANDFQLQAGSPCLDAIPSDSGDPVTIDIGGVPRPQGVGFDMGVYEKLQGAPHSPAKPTLVAPPNEAVISEGVSSIALKSGFSDPDGPDTHQSSSWRVIRADSEFVVVDMPDTQDLTEYTVIDPLSPGLKYIWQVQHKDNTGLLSPWSDEFAFKIGTSEPDTLETIQAGKSLGDFGMVSIVHWPDNPDPEAVFNIKYDPDNYRIGTWDPEQNKYIEADKGLIIEPGRAYWILTRDPLVVHFTGVPVSKVSDIEVCLHTEASARTGWNMIAPPNKANYLWNKVLVGHPDVDPPVPVTNAIASTLINHRIYEWQGGKYIDHKLDEDFVLEVYKGYWVKALVQDAYLVFPESAQVAGLSTPGNTMLAWKGKAVRWMKRLLPAPREAMADNDLPPVPMETFDGSTNPLFEGCFVQTLR